MPLNISNCDYRSVIDYILSLNSKRMWFCRFDKDTVLIVVFGDCWYKDINRDEAEEMWSKRKRYFIRLKSIWSSIETLSRWCDVPLMNFDLMKSAKQILRDLPNRLRAKISLNWLLPAILPNFAMFRAGVSKAWANENGNNFQSSRINLIRIVQAIRRIWRWFQWCALTFPVFFLC